MRLRQTCRDLSRPVSATCLLGVYWRSGLRYLPFSLSLSLSLSFPLFLSFIPFMSLSHTLYFSLPFPIFLSLSLSPSFSLSLPLFLSHTHTPIATQCTVQCICTFVFYIGFPLCHRRTPRSLYLSLRKPACNTLRAEQCCIILYSPAAVLM